MEELLRERRKAVLRRYHELCRLVHPDKCPVELSSLATRAFQRLEEAKKQAMSPGTKPNPAGRSESKEPKRSGEQVFSKERRKGQKFRKSVAEKSFRKAWDRRAAWGGK